VVTTAATGEEAVSHLKEHPVDLVVLDMIMPNGMDGLETYKAIIKLRPGQKAVITSGFSETERLRKAQELGAGVYIKKPYLMEKMGIAVRNELDRRPNRAEGNPSIE
jgi:DNA-binding NtrC family response regulator